jgi:hypothetical protein
MYRYLRNFDFASLFIKELHWSEPVTKKPISIDERHTRLEIARIAGAPVFEISTVDGQIPDVQARNTLSQELSLLFRESILIFIDKERTQSIWYWMKYEVNTYYKRKYLYTKGEPEDVFLNKITIIVSDLIATKEMREGTEKSVRHKLSAEFLRGFHKQHHQLMDTINGIGNEQDRSLYTTILLSRLIFLYFLERRDFLNNGHTTYLEDHLQESTANNYYRQFLCPLFFEGIAKPKKARSHDIGNLLGNIPYLSEDMFGPCAIELRYPDIQVPNSAFKMLFSFFSGYNWQIVDVPSRDEKEITPSILGNIFEMSFNQISTKYSFYTPVEVIDYFCRQTIEQLILTKVNQQAIHLKQSSFSSIEDMLANLDAPLCHLLLMKVLPSLSILDPACETGTFLVGALNSLIVIYGRVISRINDLKDSLLSQWLKEICLAHPNPMYYLKKTILTNNLFGVDLREDAVEITRLRLFLALIASLATSDELEPLPHVDSHLRVGNSFHLNGHENTQFDVIIANSLWGVFKPKDSTTAYHRGLQRAPIDLYKLFVERCYNLLSEGGYCGIIVPSNIYTDQGTAQLRELLFKQTRITGLFSFENKPIFGGFHPRFKITLLTFEKGQTTNIFPAAFGQAIEELDYFPAQGSIYLAADFLRRFSPDTLFIPELNNQIDIHINERMLDFPLLGERIDHTWDVQLAQGPSFSRMKRAELVGPGPDALPVYESQMIEQFTYRFSPPRYWVNVQGKTAFSKQLDQWQKSGWNGYHLSFRNIASSSNTRTLIATVLPPNVVVSNTITFVSNSLDADVLLFLTAIFNSFLADYFIRLQMPTHLIARSLIHHLPVPRLTKRDNFFLPIVKRAAHLICTTDEFKDLWKEIGADLGLLDAPAMNPVGREQLRAELDGLITHLYKITENEFSYILSEFPRVGNPTKIAAQNAYRDTERGLIV